MKVPSADDAPNDDDLRIERFGRQLLPFVGMSAATHAILLTVAMTMPDSAQALDLDGYRQSNQYAQMMLTDFQKERPPALVGLGHDTKPQQGAARHAGTEGKSGDTDAPKTHHRLAVAGPKDHDDIQLARRRNAEIAKSAGIAEQVSSVWATADQSVGNDAIAALGNLDARDPGKSKGVFGLGIRGEGPGGGGKDRWKTIGAGDVDTSGLAGVQHGCNGVSCGVGAGVVSLGGRKPTVPKPTVIGGRSRVVGTLDKEIIRRVVRQHYRELKYCYESALQKNRSLKGEVVVKFTISATGDVISAFSESKSTLKDLSVNRCVTGKIRRWVFPRVDRNPGIVIVHYPFRFHT